MKIKYAESRLILQDAPGCLWIFGAFFAFVGAVFVYGSLGGFENRSEVPRYAIYLAFLMGAMGVGVGIWQIYEHPLSRIYLDKQSRTIVFKRTGLLRKSEEIYRFEQLAEFFIDEDKDDEGDSIWRVAMKLNGGETIETTKIWERNRKDCERVAATANDFVKFN